MPAVTYSYMRPTIGRRHFVTETEVDVLLSRLPRELTSRLRRVHFNDRSRGGHIYGYVNMGHREIALCALPIRVSCLGALVRRQIPEHFGAVRGSQWPSLAVRRFMLYDVFLHELGHLQIVEPRSRDPMRKFARETKAEEFADYWRNTLWCEHCEHPDPVHNAPSEQEITEVSTCWPQSHAAYKKAIRLLHEGASPESVVDLLRFSVSAYPKHAMALEQLGRMTFAGRGIPYSPEEAIRLLNEAVTLDPSLSEATLFLAMAYAQHGQTETSRHWFERAIRLDPYRSIAITMYADHLDTWGCHEESDALFRKALRKSNRSDMAMRYCAMALLNDERDVTDADVTQALALLEKAVQNNPTFHLNHYWLGWALWVKGNDVVRARQHFEEAIRLNPDHRRTKEALAELAQSVQQ